MSDLPSDNEKQMHPAGYSTLAFTSMGHFMNDGFMFIFPVVADILSKLNGYSPLYLTGLFAAFYSASTFYGLIAGIFSDRGSFLGSIYTGILLISLGTGGFSLILIDNSLPYILGLASAIVMGIGTGFYHPIGAAIIQRAYPKKYLGKALGINGSMGSIGRAIFPSIFLGLAYFTSQGYSLSILFAVGIIGSIVIAIGLRGITATKAVSKGKTGINDVVNTSIILLTIFFLVKSLSSQGMVAWIPTFLTYEKGVGVGATLGIVLTIMYSSAILGQPLFGILVDKMDKRLLLAISSLGTAGAMFAYMHTTGDLELIMLVIFGFFTFSGFPLTMSLISDYAPKGGSSLTNSIVWGFGNSGGMILGPILSGAIILSNYSRIPEAFNILIILSIIVALMTLALPKTGKKAGMPLFG